MDNHRFSFSPASSENPTDIEAEWLAAKSTAESSFRTISQNVHSTSPGLFEQNNRLHILGAKATDSTCRDILGARNSRRTFHGCTHQGKMDDGLTTYVKPATDTYLSNRFDKHDRRPAMDHELSHQSLISARQALYLENQNRMRDGRPYVNWEVFDKLVGEINALDAKLDAADFAYVVLGRAHISRNIDIYEELRLIYMKYADFLSTGGWRKW